MKRRGEGSSEERSHRDPEQCLLESADGAHHDNLQSLHCSRRKTPPQFQPSTMDSDGRVEGAPFRSSGTRPGLFLLEAAARGALKASNGGSRRASPPPLQTDSFAAAASVCSPRPLVYLSTGAVGRRRCPLFLSRTSCGLISHSLHGQLHFKTEGYNIKKLRVKLRCPHSHSLLVLLSMLS